MLSISLTSVCLAVFGWWGRRGRRHPPCPPAPQPNPVPAPAPKPAAGLRLVLGRQTSRVSQFPGKERFPMFLLQDDQKVSLSVQAVDRMQEPTTLPAGATAVWSSSDPTIVSVVQDGVNPLAAVASSVGDPGQVKFGTAQVNVVVTDPNAPAGSSPLSASFDVQVVGGQTAGVQIVPATAESRV